MTIGQTSGIERDANRVALIVDDEVHILDTLQVWLERLGWECQRATSVSQALRVSKDPSLTLAVIDFRLEDGGDGIRLGRALRLRRGLPFVLLSAYLTTDVTVRAIRAGASDVVDKPLTESRLVDAIQAVLLNRASPGVDSRGAIDGSVGDDDRQPASRRWSHFMLRTCVVEEDPYKLALWTRGVGLSESTVRETCKLCDVSVLASRDLARILRACSRTVRTGTRLGDHIALCDDRTRRSLFERARLSPNARTVDLRGFFRNQALIETARPCLRELAHRAGNSPLFFSNDPGR